MIASLELVLGPTPLATGQMSEINTDVQSVRVEYRIHVTPHVKYIWKSYGHRRTWAHHPLPRGPGPKGGQAAAGGAPGARAGVGWGAARLGPGPMGAPGRNSCLFASYDFRMVLYVSRRVYLIFDFSLFFLPYSL